MGKRQIAEMQPFELVITLIIADLACNPMADVTIPLLHGIIPLLTLVAVHFFISLFVVKSIWFRKLINGRPMIIIDPKGIRYKELKSLNMTLNDLYEALRIAGYFSIADISYAIIETNGSLSVLPASNTQPPSAEDMSVKTEEAELDLILINDGKVIKENVFHLNLTEEFLTESLKRQNISDIGSVIIYSMNKKGSVYLQTKKGSKTIIQEKIGDSL